MLRKLKPTTPSLRHTFILKKNVNKKPFLKNRIKYFNKALGKSNYRGVVTKRHKERGCKKKYRELKRITANTELRGKVCGIEYDPYRSGYIMSIFDNKNKNFFYFLAQEGLQAGDLISTGHELAATKNGDSCLIKNLPQGLLVSNVPLQRQKGGQAALSAGSYCVLKHSGEKVCVVELPSGETREIPPNTYVTVGRVSNSRHFLEQLGKAGRSRWKGNRPKTRGIAMNPVDHPNGGGEGKKSGEGKTPWGKPGKRQGKKTSEKNV